MNPSIVQEPGEAGDPLPSNERVFRLAIPTADGKLAPEAFELSSDDKVAARPSLSVWVERFTTASQARSFLTRNQLQYVLKAPLVVSQVRSVQPDPADPKIQGLDVVWEPLMVMSGTGSQVPDPRPGARGHSGITGLHRTPPMTKLQAKSLRRQLTELARKEGVQDV